MAETVKIGEEVFELQKRATGLHDWEHTASEYVDAKLQAKSKDAVTLPNDTWQWITEWKCDGADAWEFATFKGGPYHYGETVFDFFRRRKWYRYRIKQGVTQEELQQIAAAYPKQYTILKSNKIHDHVTAFEKKLKDGMKVASEKTTKPNILILGASGAGKSSLINAVFGKPLAEIGEGKPITQHYTKYAGKDSPVVVYDSKGIENGEAGVQFVGDTKRFFKKLMKANDVDSHVHVVWYVIDLTQARFQPFEADFCRDILKGIPVIFVFNKADAVNAEVKRIMVKTVEDFKLPNCQGIFLTVANCKNFDRKDCPHCGSLKIKKRLKEGTCTIMCKECNKQELMSKVMGIEELSKATISVLPDLVKKVFLHYHKAEVIEREQKAKDVIIKLAEDASLMSHMSADLAQMAADLVAVYELDIVSERLKTAVKQKYDLFFLQKNLGTRMSMIFSELFAGKKQKQASALALGVGLELCRALIAFKKAAVDVVEMDENAKNASIEKMIANLDFDMDGNVVQLYLHELNKHGSLRKYLNRIVIDGESSYFTPEIVHEVQKEDDFVFMSYQDSAKPAEQTATTTTTTTTPVQTTTQPATTTESK